jgi:hypothetical protein|tara:strand:+ start:962 stop:1159 length:198 start_codon:yes stop_codon:yes gene_type:complete
MSKDKKYKYVNGHLKLDPAVTKQINKLYNQDPLLFRELIGVPKRRTKKAKGGLIQGHPRLAERGF